MSYHYNELLLDKNTAPLFSHSFMLYHIYRGNKKKVYLAQDIFRKCQWFRLRVYLYDVG